MSVMTMTMALALAVLVLGGEASSVLYTLWTTGTAGHLHWLRTRLGEGAGRAETSSQLQEKENSDAPDLQRCTASTAVPAVPAKASGAHSRSQRQASPSSS